MKTLNLLTTGAFAAMMLLSSCTKDVNDGPGAGNGNDNGVVEGVATYATVTLSQKGGARTYADPGQNPDYANPDSEASAAEKNINDAAVLVFSDKDILEKVVVLKNGGNGTFGGTFPTTTGKKRLYALANLSEPKYEAIAALAGEAKQLPNVCKVIQQIANINEAAKVGAQPDGSDGNFYMSNVYKLDATIEDQITVLNKTEDEVKDGTDETANNFKIYIGRMTAKVSLAFANNLVPKSGDGAFDAAGAVYRVRNNPTRFYTFPVYDNAQNMQLLSPYFERTYDVKNPVDYADNNASVGKADFFDNGHDNNPDDGINHTFVAPNVDSYLTENSPKEAMRHKVTFLSIKSKWTPNENAVLLNADGTEVADKTTALKKITNDAANNGNDGTFWRVQYWKDGIIAGYAKGIYIDKPTHYTAIDGTAPDQDAFAADRDAAKRDGGYLIVEYTGGIAYYAYWMNNGDQNNGIAKKYALKRNNHFKLTITSVDGIGEPDEDDNLDKEEAIEADTHMKATIEVLNWNEVIIDGGI